MRVVPLPKTFGERERERGGTEREGIVERESVGLEADARMGKNWGSSSFREYRIVQGSVLSMYRATSIRQLHTVSDFASFTISVQQPLQRDE